MLLERRYFEIQATYAARVAELTGVPILDAYRTSTTFYAVARDNDAGAPPGRNDFDPHHPEWEAFARAIADGHDAVDYVYDNYLKGDATKDDGLHCFAYNYWPDERIVRIHFGNNADGTALRPESFRRCIDELRGILGKVALEHPDARAVRGTSWLYHLPAYRRLFPPAYTAGLRSAGHLPQFAALWAQFLDRHGRVKPDLAQRFLDGIARSASAEKLSSNFPLDVLATTADVRHFYEHYAVAAPKAAGGPQSPG